MHFCAFGCGANDFAKAAGGLCEVALSERGLGLVEAGAGVGVKLFEAVEIAQIGDVPVVYGVVASTSAARSETQRSQGCGPCQRHVAHRSSEIAWPRVACVTAARQLNHASK